MKKLISILLVLAMVFTMAPMGSIAADEKVFSDVNDSDYYAKAAEALATLDVLAGYPDGTFGAEKSITRAEMAAIVCRIIDKEEDAKKAVGETKFDDVDATHWASGYVNVAVEAGVINGDGNGKFRPEDDVLYEEAIKMVVCALGYGEDIVIDAEDWSKNYIKKADEKGLVADLTGEKGKPATRGDVAVLSYNGLATDKEDAKIPATPVASVEEGEYSKAQKVALSTTTKDATIYYTLDGKEPTVKSKKYTKAISVSSTMTLKAIAVKNDVVSKDVLSVKYTIKLAASGGGGGGGGGAGGYTPPATYTVVFNLNYDGATGEPAQQPIGQGGVAVKPADPVRDGYNFVGWTLSTATNEIYNFSTQVFSNVVLYAVWKDIVTVSFDLNYEGAVGAPAQQVIGETGLATAPINPVRDGYNFVGWTLSTETNEIFDFSTTISADTVLYAVWAVVDATEPMEVVLTANQEEIFTTTEATMVTLYAEVKNAQAENLDVKLHDGNGELICQMKDDGAYSSNGDELSNDNIYTCRVPVDALEEKELSYVAKLTDGEVIESNVITINVIESMSQQQIDNMAVVDNTLEANLLSAEEYADMTADERQEHVQEQLEELADQGLVNTNSIVFNDDSTAVSFQYESGVVGTILLREWAEEQNGHAEERQRISDSNRHSQNAFELFGEEDNDVFTMSLGDLEIDAKVLWSFGQADDNASYRKPFYEDLEQDWEDIGVDTDVNFNTQVEDYKNLEGSEIIVFAGHGIFTTHVPDKFGSTYIQAPSLVLHEKSDTNKDAKYAKDLKTLRLSKLTLLPKSGPTYTVYAILPAFWNEYYGTDGLDGAFVYGENCEFYGKNGNMNYSMAEALLGCSAEAVVGFHNSVMADYSRELMKEYVEALFEGYSAGAALDIAKAEHGENDYFLGRELFYGPTAYPVFRGNSAATLEDADFKNGSFEESASFNRWRKQGDVRAISKLGELLPQHQSKMAILTTGIGSGTSDYMEATEGSVLYQTFKVPSNVTTLSFDYNVVSEEPMEWVGTGYDDKFKVEIVYEDFTNQLVLETVNTSTWYEVNGIDFDGGDDTTYQTGWVTQMCDISAYQGKTITLRFVVYDVGDSIYDTSALIDNVAINNAAIVGGNEFFKYTQESVVSGKKYDGYEGFYDIAQMGAVVPGLKADIVPQGIAYRADKDQYYISGYIKDEMDNSVILVLDAKTNKYVGEYYLNKADGSDFTGHAGGIAITEKDLFVANGKALSRISLAQIDELGDCGDLCFEENIQLSIGDAGISFCTYSDGVLWIGNFWEEKDYDKMAYENHKALALGYIFNNNTHYFREDARANSIEFDYEPDYICKIPEKTQGITFVDGQMVISQSYGRTNVSKLYYGEDPTILGFTDDFIFLDGEMKLIYEFPSQVTEVVALPMMEGLTCRNGKVVALFESGAKKYKDDGGLHPTDRLWIIDIQ